ncbi:MAG: TolC family protein [Proteobacteria bacterium]|nr:TolC family protein [Pseudomonadota bacterium]
MRPRGRVACGPCALLALGALLGLAGCKTFSADGGMDAVADIAARELRKDVVAVRTPQEAEAVRARIAQLLARPLDADAAVQIALLNNRGLQASFNELGIAEARMVGASLPPNPGFSVERLSGPVEIEVEKRIIANVLALVTLPARAKIASERFRAAQLAIAGDVLRVAADARRAYYRALAARELEQFLTQAVSAAGTASALGERLGRSGGMNKLDQAREHVFYAELTSDLARARLAAAGEREALTRLIGLWGGDIAFRLPPRLPPLPRRATGLPAVESEAMQRRIDIALARAEIAALIRLYGLTQATRFVNLLEVDGVGRTTRDRAEGHKVRDSGIEIGFQIPLFDFGEVKVREARETYMQAVNRLAATAINARSQARAAYAAYRSSHDIAAHYDREVLPLRKIISEETLLRYNAMQIDVFALLTEARQRIAASTNAIAAHRDFWLASVNLAAAVAGDGAGGGAGPAPAVATAAAEGGGGH